MLVRLAALAFTALFAGCTAMAQPAPGPVTWESTTLGKITYDQESGPYGVLKIRNHLRRQYRLALH